MLVFVAVFLCFCSGVLYISIYFLIHAVFISHAKAHQIAKTTVYNQRRYMLSFSLLLFIFHPNIGYRGCWFNPSSDSNIYLSLPPLLSLRVVVSVSGRSSDEMKDRGPVCCRRVHVKDPTTEFKKTSRKKKVEISPTL